MSSPVPLFVRAQVTHPRAFQGQWLALSSTQHLVLSTLTASSTENNTSFLSSSSHTFVLVPCASIPSSYFLIARYSNGCSYIQRVNQDWIVSSKMPNAQMSKEELDSFIVRFLPVDHSPGVYWLQIGSTLPVSVVGCTAQGTLQIVPFSAAAASSTDASFPQPISFFLDSGTLVTTSLSVQPISLPSDDLSVVLSTTTTMAAIEKSGETTTDEFTLSLWMWIGIAFVAISILAIIIYFAVKLRQQGHEHENRSLSIVQPSLAASSFSMPVSQVRLNANLDQLPKFSTQ